MMLPAFGPRLYAVTFHCVAVGAYQLSGMTAEMFGGVPDGTEAARPPHTSLVPAGHVTSADTSLWPATLTVLSYSVCAVADEQYTSAVTVVGTFVRFATATPSWVSVIIPSASRYSTLLG